MLGVEPRASYMQSKRSPTELHPLCMGTGGGLGNSPHPRLLTLLCPKGPKNSQGLPSTIPIAASKRLHAGHGDMPTPNTLPIPAAPGTGALPPPWPWSHRGLGLCRPAKESGCPKGGLVRELNPGPLAPEARIIPLDQRAGVLKGGRNPLLEVQHSGNWLGWDGRWGSSFGLQWMFTAGRSPLLCPGCGAGTQTRPWSVTALAPKAMGPRGPGWEAGPPGAGSPPRQGDVAQRESACFACKRPWVQSPASPAFFASSNPPPPQGSGDKLHFYSWKASAPQPPGQSCPLWTWWQQGPPLPQEPPPHPGWDKPWPRPSRVSLPTGTGQHLAPSSGGTVPAEGTWLSWGGPLSPLCQAASPPPCPIPAGAVPGSGCPKGGARPGVEARVPQAPPVPLPPHCSPAIGSRGMGLPCSPTPSSRE